MSAGMMTREVVRPRYVRLTAALATSFLLVLVVASGAQGATGDLTPQGCIAQPGGSDGCGTTQQGLTGAEGVAVSPDGRSVYVASATSNAIARFDRDTTTGYVNG